MKDRDTFSHDSIEDEGNLPAGWEPEHDTDLQWKTMARLIEDAGTPPVMPPPAAFDALRLTAARQLRQEGILKDLPQTEVAAKESTSWLVALLTGRAPAGTFFRMAAVGAAAFLIGVSLSDPDSTTTSTPVEIASAPTAAPTTAPPATTPTEIASADTPAPQGMRVDRSYSAATDGSNDLNTLSNGWVFQPGARPVAVSGQAAGVYGDGRPELASDAIEQLQVLKYLSMVERNERNLAEIRRVEQTLTQLVEADSWDGNPRTTALDAYRVGERALAAQRYSESQRAFERAAELHPGSSIAFMAHFQVGRLSMEATNDYVLALESFRKCLEDYPSHFLTDQHKNYLVDRVDILAQGASSNWKWVSTWLEAEQSNRPLDAMVLLQAVITHGESPRLAAQAAERLRDVSTSLTGLPTPLLAKAAECVALRLAKEKPSHEAGRLQFVLADLGLRANGNLDEAAAAYRKVLQLTSDAAMTEQVQSRLGLIQERIGGGQ